MDRGGGGELSGDEVEDAPGLIDGSGHQQVPDQHALDGGSIPVQAQIADLPVHFDHGCPRNPGVIGGIRIGGGRFGAPEFKIGHVDVNNPVEQPQGFFRFIAAAIIDQR